MEDILASIRRILNEDEVAPASPAPASPALASPAPAIPAPQAEPKPHAPDQPNAGGSGGGDDGVLVLDEAMLVNPPIPPPPVMPPPLMAPVQAPPPAALETHPDAALLAPTTAAAAAASVGSLLRTIASERSTQTHRGGPTIEDLVREELRPLLKVWLDEHLPPMVERVVRQEIERLTGQALP